MQMLRDGQGGMEDLMTGNGTGTVPNLGAGSVPGAPDAFSPGSLYTGFVAEVNEMIEERDVALALLHVSHDRVIPRFALSFWDFDG